MEKHNLSDFDGGMVVADFLGFSHRTIFKAELCDKTNKQVWTEYPDWSELTGSQE